ncbi:MAG: hypothetical protein V4507_06255 [Verrucomicrobiota bacterium]
MKRTHLHATRLVLGVIASLLSGSLSGATITWTGVTGNWSGTTNWDSASLPATNDSVVLGNATSNRTVSFDNASSLTISDLTMNETTAGVSNILQFTSGVTAVPSLTVTNGIVLGSSAAGSLAEISLVGANSSSLANYTAFNAAGGLTLNSGGLLQIGYGSTPAGFLAMTGSVTLNGGTLNVAAPSTGTPYVTIGTKNGALGGSDLFTMNSGLVSVHGTSYVVGGVTNGTQSRFQVNGTFDWEGGTFKSISDAPAGAGSLILHGLTNTIGSGAVYQNVSSSNVTTTVAPTFTMSITDGSNSATHTNYVQTLNTAVDLGNVTLREMDGNRGTGNTYTHTITSTSAQQKIGVVSFGNGGSDAKNIFQIGSNLTSSSTGVLISNGATGSSNAATYFSVDLNGYTFDGTSSTVGFKLGHALFNGTAALSNNWELKSSATGGKIKAQSFDLGVKDSSGNVFSTDSLIIGNNVILNATGGNGSANILSVAGGASSTFDAGSTFLYTGAATVSNAATLTSSAPIGGLQVQSGALNLNQATFSTKGDVVVTGGTLLLNGASAGTLSLASGKNFSASNATISLTLDTTSDQIIGSGSGTWSLSNATLNLTLGSGFDYGTNYSVFSGFSSGSATNVVLTGYDSAMYVYNLDTAGHLSFSAVPEPSQDVMIGFGFLIALVLTRNLKKRDSDPKVGNLS